MKLGEGITALRRRVVGSTLDELGISYLHSLAPYLDGKLMGSATRVEVTPVGRLFLDDHQRTILAGKTPLEVVEPIGSRLDRSIVRLRAPNGDWTNIKIQDLPAFRKVEPLEIPHR